MQPSGAEIEQLQRALLQAYTFADFRTMLRTGWRWTWNRLFP